MGKIEWKALAGLAKSCIVTDMNLLWYRDRTWDPMDIEISWEILDESHAILLFVSFRHRGKVTGCESFIVMA